MDSGGHLDAGTVHHCIHSKHSGICFLKGHLQISSWSLFSRSYLLRKGRFLSTELGVLIAFTVMRLLQFSILEQCIIYLKTLKCCEGVEQTKENKWKRTGIKCIVISKRNDLFSY